MESKAVKQVRATLRFASLVCVKKRIVNKILNVGDGFPVPIYLEFVMFMFHIKKGR